MALELDGFMPVILRFLRVEGVRGSGLLRTIAPWAQGCVGLQGMDSWFLPEPSPASFAQSRHGPSCTFPLIAAGSLLPSWSWSLPRRHRKGKGTLKTLSPTFLPHHPVGVSRVR